MSKPEPVATPVSWSPDYGTHEIARLRAELARERTMFSIFIGRAVKLRAELDEMIESVRGMDNAL